MRWILLLIGCVSGVTRGGVPVGINGTWYDPARPGHGFGIEVRDTELAIAIWHTYENDGNPLTLYLVGRIEGDSIAADAFAPRGMRFHEFDPADLVEDPWGTVRFDFSDCNHASVTYAPTAAGFAAGTLSIERLLVESPTQCTLDAAESVPVGRYDSSIAAYAVVHPDETLYFVQDAGQNWLDAQGSPMLVGRPVRNAAGLVEYALQPLMNDWLCRRHPGVCALDPSPYDVAARATFHTTSRSAAGLFLRDGVHETAWGPLPSFHAPYGGTTDGAVREERLLFTDNGDTTERLKEYRVVVSGRSLCVKPAGGPCEFLGELDASGAFTLREAGAAEPRTFHGYAFYTPWHFNEILRFVGRSDDGHGLAFCAGPACY